MHIIIGIPAQDIIAGIPIAIIAFIALQRSVSICMLAASIGIIRQVMPSFVISQVIRHITGIAIIIGIIGMPPIIDGIIPGMPPIIPLIIDGIIPPMGIEPMGICMPIGMGIGIIIGICIGMPPWPIGMPPAIGIAFIGVIAASVRTLAQRVA